MTVITGETLRIARQVYGFKTQEDLAEAMGVKVGTIQRHESALELSSKIAGEYQMILGFDLFEVASFIRRFRTSKRATHTLTISYPDHV